MEKEHEKYYGWHLDRRVSWGHVITTLVVAVSFAVWLLSLDGKVDINSRDIHTMRMDDAKHELIAKEQFERLETKIDSQTMRLEGRMEVQYSEIIRRLEILDERLLQHSTQREAK